MHRGTGMCSPQCTMLALFLGLSSASAVKAGDIPRDETGFTEYVAAQMRKEVAGDSVTIKGPLTLGFGELQANLNRIYGFCKIDSDGCAQAVTTFVKGAAQAYQDRNALPTRDAVRLVVRTTGYLQSIPAGPTHLQSRPLVEGLVILPCIDSPRTMRMFTDKDNKALGLSADEVYALGATNLRATLKPLMEVAKATGHGQIGQLVGDTYQPSRLALHDDWAPLAAAQSGKLIVSAPATDAMFYIGEDTPRAIDALRTLSRNVMNRAPNQLTDLLLKWNQTGWEVVK